MKPLLEKSRPLRLRVGRLVDILLVSDPEHIRWLNAHPDVDREIDEQASWLHRLVARRLLRDMAFHGQVLPVFLARSAPGRAEQQKKLEERFEALQGAPGPEREQIARYVSGDERVEDIGVTVQQWCGRLFFPQYLATPQTYDAGRKLATWPVAPPFRAFWQRVSGRLEQAKERLWRAAEHDVHCVHGTSIGMENIARSVRRLRRAARSGRARTAPPEEILRDCLSAPVAVLRSCRAEVPVPFSKAPLTEQTFIVLLVARAFVSSGDFDVAFLAGGWSACPARRVITEMLRAVWQAAHQEAAEPARSPNGGNGKSALGAGRGLFALHPRAR